MDSHTVVTDHNTIRNFPRVGKINLITKSLDGCEKRGSAAYNHLLWFMSESSLFSMFSCFSLTRCQSSAVSPLSAELSESPELYQTARLTVSHMSAGKVPDTARRSALTLPVSQIQVMCSVFFSGLNSRSQISASVFLPGLPPADRMTQHVFDWRFHCYQAGKRLLDCNLTNVLP